MQALTAPEKKILKALNTQYGKKFKGNQLMEWSTGNVEAQAGEVAYYVEAYGVNVAIKVLP